MLDKIVDGQIQVDQGIIAGCAGGLYENLEEAAAILNGGSVGNGAFALSVYPASTPINQAMAENGILASLLEAGVVLNPVFAALVLAPAMCLTIEVYRFGIRQEIFLTEKGQSGRRAAGYGGAYGRAFDRGYGRPWRDFDGGY